MSASGGGQRPSVSEGALAKLASALVREDDVLMEPCTVATLIASFTEQDRTVLGNIVRRIAEVEKADGSEAAEVLLADILAVLARERANAA